MTGSRIHFLLGISRAPFLPLSLLCALLGISTGAGSVSGLLAAMAALAAVLAHASVNAFNEYEDYRSGLDLHTCRTPFSGGSGSLPAAPQYLFLARGWAWLTLASTVAIGLYFLVIRGWWLAGLGACGLLLALTYTPLINRYPWLCLVAPGIGFGPVMVVGSAIAVTGATSSASIWSAAIMGVLASGLLLANQQPDAAVDARFGRRHLAIAYGPAFARKVLATLWLSPVMLLAAAIAINGLPPLAVIAAFPLLLACYNALQLQRLPYEAALPTALLGRNVLVCLVTPICMTVALLVS